MIISEKHCKSILNKSGISDYCVNPYTGCGHGCVYCYARFMKKYTNHSEPWGEFVDVKSNAVEVLNKEIIRKEKGKIMLSSVTDAYQPVEKKFELTRQLLKTILTNQFPALILTKSSLVLRDLDLIRKFNDISVEFTIPYLDEKARQAFEPFASPIAERLEALSQLKKAGIRTGVFFGPIMPLISDKNLENTFDKFAELELDLVYVDRLNIKCGNWPDIRNAIESNYPEMLNRYEEIFFARSDYYENLKKRITALLKERGLRFEICY